MNLVTSPTASAIMSPFPSCIVVGQNDAEVKKKACEELAAELAIQNEAIAKRKAEVEEDLANVEPALAEARTSVRGIKKAHLDEIRARKS